MSVTEVFFKFSADDAVSALPLFTGKALYSEAQGELQRDAEGPERGDVDGLGHPEGGPEGRRRRRRDGRELGEGGVEGADDGEERAVE